MSKIFKIGVIGLSLLLLGCDKNGEISKPITDGTYSGTFTVTYGSEKNTGVTTVKFENGKYTCTGNPNRIPAGGSGTYSINGNKITFRDENIWTAEFNWRLILNGEYDFTFDGKKLKFSTGTDGNHYEYNLKKQ